MKRLSIAEARKSLRGVVEKAQHGIPVELTKRGEAVAIVLSIDQYRKLQGKAPSFWDVFSDFQKNLTPDELLLDEWDSLRDKDPGREVAL